MQQDDRYVRWFETLSNTDVPIVGGKNASLGEMVRTFKNQGISVPHGFATTAAAYWEFLKANNLRGKVEALLTDWRQGGEVPGRDRQGHSPPLSPVPIPPRNCRGHQHCLSRTEPALQRQ